LPPLTLHAVMAELGADRLSFHQTTMDSTISAKHFDKGNLAALRDRVLGPDAETVAIGDSEPDLAMFRIASCSFAPAHIECASQARMLGCRVARRPYQAGLLEIARMIAHSAGGGCRHCTEAATVFASGNEMLAGLLRAADRTWLSNLLRILARPALLTAFIRRVSMCEPRPIRLTRCARRSAGGWGFAGAVLASCVAYAATNQSVADQPSADPRKPSHPAASNPPAPFIAAPASRSEMARLVSRLEKEIMEGRILDPPDDNAHSTFQKIGALIPSASETDLQIVFDIRKRFRTLAQTLEADGKLEQAHRLSAAAEMPALEAAGLGKSQAGSANSATLGTKPAPNPDGVGASPVVPSPNTPAPRSPAVSAQADPREPGTSSGEETLLQRARAMSARGDLAAARLLYIHAAADGSAAAATGAGKTYDPVCLARSGAKGLQPDPNLAAIWYRKAVALGDPEALVLLQQLLHMEIMQQAGTAGQANATCDLQ
jgi:hypothetical protein